MRVVIDTNVFVSAALKDTSQPAIAAQLACQRGILLRSDASARQLFDVLARPCFSMLASYLRAKRPVVISRAHRAAHGRTRACGIDDAEMAALQGEPEEPV